MNDYVIASLRTRPQWRGTAILAPSTDRYILERMAEDGMVGVRLPFISLRDLPDLDSWEWRKFLYRLADMDWHVHLHLDGPRIPQVLPQLERSGVKIVIDHIGRPDPVLGVASEGFKAVVRSVEQGRTWVKLSGAYRLGPQAADHARELCRRVGYERMLWASNWPHPRQTPYDPPPDDAELLDTLLDWAPDDATRRKILADNPATLYGF